VSVVLGSRPVLSWQGFDAIGQRAKIAGDGESGFECACFDEEEQRWRAPRDLDEYRWIVEAFLAEMVAGSEPGLED
jgi:hypothetical protein